MMSVRTAPWRRAFSVILCLITLLVLAVDQRPTAAWERTALVDPAPDVPDQRLERALSDLVNRESGAFGIAVKHLWTGQTATVNSDKVIEAASLYKLAVMYELFRQVEAGLITLDDPFIVADLIGYDSAGFPLYGASYHYPVGEALYDMITVSDNDAAQLLLYRLGPEQINETMNGLGLSHTLVDYDTSTTAGEMLRLLELMATGQAVSRDASQAMLSVLLQQQINDRIPAGLPDAIPVAHKTGELPGLFHDAGIVYADAGPFILVIMIDDVWDVDDAREAVRRISRFVHNYFAERATRPDRRAIP